MGVRFGHVGIGSDVSSHLAVRLPNVEDGTTMEHFRRSVDGVVSACERHVQPADGGVQYVPVVQGSYRKDAYDEGSPATTFHLRNVHVRFAAVGVRIAERHYE